MKTSNGLEDPHVIALVGTTFAEYSYEKPRLTKV
jgi:hypothetical protein